MDFSVSQSMIRSTKSLCSPPVKSNDSCPLSTALYVLCFSDCICAWTSHTRASRFSIRLSLVVSLGLLLGKAWCKRHLVSLHFDSESSPNSLAFPVHSFVCHHYRSRLVLKVLELQRRKWTDDVVIELVSFYWTACSKYGPCPRIALSPPLSSCLSQWNKITIILRSAVNELMYGFWTNGVVIELNWTNKVFPLTRLPKSA